MSAKSFDPGDVGLYGEAFLNAIYKQIVKSIEELKVLGRSGDLSYLTLSELVDKHWEESWHSQEGQRFQRIIAGALAPHQADNVKKAKPYLLHALLPFIVTPEPPEITEDGDDKGPLPVCNGYHWTLMKQQLEKKFNKPVLQSIDRQSSRVLKQILFSPDEKEFRKMGLVLGQVQSGKTANYSALIAKACDAGYKLIIVLSGIHNDLRQQTQERLDEEFLGYHEYMKSRDELTGQIEQRTRSIPCGVGLLSDYDPGKAPESATYTDDDFRGILKTGAGKRPPVIFVIKKWPTVFNKMNHYFSDPSNAHRYKHWPVLIIDDEADLASINTKKGDLASVTNSYIRSLLQIFPKAAFVAYTATPFANVLIDAKANHRKLGIDLFPKDFIISLPAPVNYFGPAQFFGDNQEDVGLELFMPISEHSSDLLIGDRRSGRGRRHKPLRLDVLPPECIDVLRQFILSATIRLWRFKRFHPDQWHTDLVEAPSDPILEMSALVHVSSFTADQRVVATLFADLLETAFREPLLYGNQEDRQEVLHGFRSLFDNQKRVTARTAEIRERVDVQPDWSLPKHLEDLLPEMKIIVADAGLRIVNGEKLMGELVTPEHDDLNRSFCRPVIFIGGNKLSRGLTLPGLCVSLFLRTSTMYDTLLQMGRWFGYRDGYVDLCRICTTTHIINRFRAISEACLDFEQQIDRMSSLHRTPENYRLSILSHTGLQVTARNKMTHADEARVSFNGDILECRDLSVTTEDLVSNWRAAKYFYADIKDCGELVYASKGYPLPAKEEVASYFKKQYSPSGRLWRKVPVNCVLTFLDSYLSNKDSGDVYRRGVIDYIRKAIIHNELLYWNIFIPGEACPDSGTFGVKFVTRTMQIANVDPTSALLPTLKGGSHEFVGVPKSVIARAVDRTGEKQRGLFREVRQAAGELQPDTGYLILYLMKPRQGDLTNDCYVREAEAEIGEAMPFISYYVWLPKSPHDRQTSAAVFNDTVVDHSDDEWDEEMPEAEEED